MSTFDYLIDHARKNVWCAPEQDFQVILTPKRISPKNGARNNLEVLWSTIPLPTSTDWYHVYQIGEITPELIGMSGKQMAWITVTSHCNAEKLIVDVYTKKGRQFPRYQSYLLYTRDGNVLLAVKEQPRIADLNVEDIYIRFYSNAYFARPEAQNAANGIEVKGMTIPDLATQYAFQKLWRDSKVRKGLTYAFVNGYRVQDLNTSTVKVGDLVEWIWDSSIKKVVELKVKDLNGFLSSLDQKQKYLVHYPEAQAETIDYRDDLDFFVINRTNVNIFTGVYYHKNKEDAVRMVTHKDYSVPVPYVNGYVNDNKDVLKTVDVISLQIHVRESGFFRPLINEHHRIKELYKLPEGDLIKAMMGVDSNVTLWQAASLESSVYPAIMRSLDGQITRQMVQDAYGYNAISKLVGDTPQRYTPPANWVELPYALRKGATIYEYDANGKLLNWHLHDEGRFYPARDVKCRLIEGIMGQGGTTLTTKYQAEDFMPAADVNYRYYACQIINEEPDGVWLDVTGNTDYYVILNGVVTWNVDLTKWYTAIKNDVQFLAYDLVLSYRDGILRFTVNADEIRTDGVLYPGKAELPFGQFDLWLNGRPLIENLDYFVAWPEVCIVNKEYLVSGASQRISIRGTGFCRDDMSRDKPAEFGFVDHGLLSKNRRYDIRDDKVIRIVVDGAVYTREDLKFSEEDSGLRMTAPRNGAPYQITDLVVPLRGLVDENTYTFRDKSLVVDKMISDYLTLKLPEPPEVTPNPIPQLYQIYSPFTSKVMYDLLHGILRMDNFQGSYSDMLVKSTLEPYQWLLAYEPTFKDIDYDYVSVHPHNLYTEVTLNVYQYRFLLRAIRLFLPPDTVSITKFIRIETGFEHETPDHPHPYRVAP